MTTRFFERAMSSAVLPCHSVYLMRSPLLTTCSAFSMHRRAMVSPLESDGMLRSQASVCASTSASIICGPFAQSCPSNSSAVVLFSEKGRKYTDKNAIFIPACGWMVACANSMRATGAGPATARGPSRKRMDTPPPRQLRAVPWCCTPPGQRRWLQGGGRLRHTHYTQNNTFLSCNFVLSARRFARVRPTAFLRNSRRQGQVFSSTSPFRSNTVRMFLLTAQHHSSPSSSGGIVLGERLEVVDSALRQQ
ncbi:hypothetical protein TCSYLVIO_004021 [Trypanosoma cruzi]|nr:hypothetical protein TCSYLVIO_004021 [Trypanosoma cruzi]